MMIMDGYCHPASLGDGRRALGLLRRDIQSYSLLHIMELSSQRANGSDPFNLCQKHTDEEVPNARPLPRGRHSTSPPTAPRHPPPPRPPPWLLPILLLDSLTAAPHLSSFTAQSGETGRSASPAARSLARSARRRRHLHGRRAQGHGGARLRKEPMRVRRGDGMGTKRLLEAQVNPDEGLEVTLADVDTEAWQSSSRQQLRLCHTENCTASKLS